VLLNNCVTSLCDTEFSEITKGVDDLTIDNTSEGVFPTYFRISENCFKLFQWIKFLINRVLLLARKVYMDLLECLPAPYMSKSHGNRRYAVIKNECSVKKMPSQDGSEDFGETVFVGRYVIMSKFSLIVFFSLLSFNLLASPDSDYELGVKAYKAGDNEAAARYFESAMNQGMNALSLQFNLASSYYKVGRYEEAKKLFEQLYKTEAMRDLAEYNLGLIALKQNEWPLARDYFTSVVNSGRDKKLTSLSEQQLAILNKAEKRVKVTAFANIGYDDNVVSVSSESALNESDSYFDAYAAVDYLISGKRGDGWIADASVYMLHYDDIDSSNLDLYELGVKRTLKLSDWTTSLQLKYSTILYGDEDYTSSMMLDAKGYKKLSRVDRLYLRYRYEDISSDDAIYDYLEGSRHRAKLEYRNTSSKNIRQLYYELEINDRGDLVGSSYSYEYSPTRHTLRGKLTHFLNEDWHLRGDLSYRFSDFPSSSTMDREDERWKLVLAADYLIDTSFKLSSKLQFIDNSSTEDRYEYDKSMVSVGLVKTF